MKRSIAKAIGTLAALMFCMTAGASVARADEDEIVAKVPFDFVVGTAHMPAGKYIVKPAAEGPGVVSIERADGHAAVFALTAPMAWDANAPNAELVFQKHENHYFLSKLVSSDGSERELVPVRTSSVEPVVAADNP